MRVLAVTTWFPSASHRSTGAFVVKDLHALASLGHDVHLVHLRPPGQDPADPVVPGTGGPGEWAPIGITDIEMSTSRPDDVARAGRELAPLIASADLLHTMAFSALLPMALRRSPVPWVHTEHWSGLTAPATLPRAWRLLLPGLTPLLRAPDIVTAVCDYLAEPIRGVRGRRPVQVVPCIVPAPARVKPRPAPDGEIAMVSVGGLIERKDPLLAVDVVRELGRRGHPARLTLVGQGPLADAVRQRAVALDVADRVELTGVLDAAGVAERLAAADLFLGPTRGDNFFVSCAEALVHGRPVVVGSTGGQVEYIDPGVGQTVDTQDAAAYADAVLAVLDRAEGRTAQDIADTIGDRFSMPAVAEGYAGAHRAAEQGRGPR